MSSTLETLAAKLNSITVTGTSTAAHAVTIAANLTSYLPGTIAVTDTGANVVSSLAGLQPTSARSTRSPLTNSGMAMLVTSAMLSTDTAVFGKISAYTLTVSDTLGITTVNTINSGYAPIWPKAR